MSQNSKKNNGFTLIELLIVIAIIGVLSAMTLGVLADSADNAKKSRTKVQIRRINNLIMDLWESFETRPIRLRLDSSAIRGPKDASEIRLYALRAMMRMELPDRMSDIIGFDGLKTPSEVVSTDTDLTSQNRQKSLSDFYFEQDRIITVPRANFDLPAPFFVNALNSYYFNTVINNVRGANSRRATPVTWGELTANQGAECLYLILSGIQDENGTGLDSINDSEIDDVDGDGMMEILDGWGTPIQFLRWAPGMSELAVDFANEWNPPPTIPTTGLISPIQSGNASTDPDPFDPLRADWRNDISDDNPRNDTFRLVPLIYSAGSDRSYDIWRRDENDYDFWNLMQKPDSHIFDGRKSDPNEQLINYTLIDNDPYAGVGLADDTTPSVGFRLDFSGGFSGGFSKDVYDDGPSQKYRYQSDRYDGFIDNIDNHFGFEQ